ncbi:BING4CT-domain-containing protein [Phellopilus nigrolimitatus]|nr:BING4CT-domain-containing protein [Phellopilus nigrolimitatus]
MDSLIAKADAVRPRKHSRPDSSKKASPSSLPAPDRTSTSIHTTTSLPRSLRPSEPLPKKGVKSHAHIPNKSLRLELDRRAAHAVRTKAARDDAALLTTAVGAEPGRLEADGDMERTWRVGQAEIARAVGAEAASQRREWVLDGGPYRTRYTRNGRHLAIAGRNGHVASFDWQTGTVHAELQLRETCRDVTYLHDQSHFAVAQKKYVFIYDQNGVELHKLSHHLEPTRLEFLPYHWLLASVGNAGHLKYQDTSTGQLVAAHRTALGPCTTLTQNPHSAVLYLGHQNGCVTLWTPNLAHPAVRLQAHLGALAGAAVDPRDAGRYLATAGVDGRVKVWDSRMWGVVREWSTRGGGGEVEWSQKGVLAVASGGSVSTYNPPHNHTPMRANALAPPPLYLTHPLPAGRPLTSLRFCPFTDVLAVGHARGVSSLLVPGAGEAHFDSAEADPYENRRMRREREVRGLLDKGRTPDVPFARRPRVERLRLEGKYAEQDDKEEGEEGSEEEGGGWE